MSNHYTGNRYVPKILRDDDYWSLEKEYESLTVVCYQGNSYTSRQYVPKGIDINNKDFWSCTGNYNAQIERYRLESQQAVEDVREKLTDFNNTQDNKFELKMNEYKKDINSYTEGKYSEIDDDIKQINNNISDSKDSINSNIRDCQNTLENTVDGYTKTVNNQINKVEEILTTIDIVYDEGTSTDVIDDDDLTIIEGGIY